MSVEAYLLYLAVLAAFFATPPDTSQLLIISNSLRHGVRRSLATVAGDLTANSLQMTAAAFGLTAVIATSADALTVVKWLGVGYLVWIGIRLMRSTGQRDPVASAAEARPIVLFRQGFLTSAANPYAVIFFGALFPQFLDPNLPIWPQLLILGVTYLVVDGLLLVLWGWAAVKAVGRLRSFGGVWINRLSGALMIGAAALLASKDLADVKAAPE
ncbi:MAG: LysE family translocator [Pseudomonadota bacterium]